MTQSAELSIIIVNWNVRDLVRECLRSVFRTTRLARERYEVIVVDNASQDGSVEMLRAEFGDDIRLIAADGNLGFVEGNQRGYEVSSGRYVLLLNPDTVATDGAIDGMLRDLEARPDVAVIGARLANSDGSFQRACGGALPSTWNVAAHHLLFGRLLPARIAPPPLFLLNDPPGLFEIGWVSGAAMLLRREALGPRIFDPEFFMFGEDMDLCRRMARNGWKVLYASDCTIIHHHRQSFERQSSSEVLATLHTGPRSFFAQSHGSFSVLLYDLIFLAGYLLRWPAYRALSVLRPGRGHDARAQFSRLYVRIVLRSLRRRRTAPVGTRPAVARPAASAATGPRFSVIINIYNGEDFLKEAIDSVLAQSFQDWELILWDDWSSDRSAAICAGYSDARIRYILAPEHGGIGAARNQAVACAHGDWIAFLDQDDIWLPNKLKAQNALIEQDRTGRLSLVYGRTERFDARGRTSPFDPWYGPSRLPEGDILEQLLRKPSFVALSSVAFRKAALVELGGIPPDIVYCPDYYLCVAVARAYRSAACVQDLCCLYRVHASSMSHVYRKQIHEEALRIIAGAVEPSQWRVLRARRWVHNTWIGVEEIRSDGVMRGLSRILRHGSLLYLALRPFMLLGRAIRHRLAWR